MTRRPAGELESAVLAALWAAGTPLTPPQVQQSLGGSLARTTIATILSRLYEKGTVVRSRAGRAYAYSPAVEDEAALAARRMHTELDKGDDRTGVLTRFVSRLSPDDERVLRELLAQTETDGSSDSEQTGIPMGIQTARGAGPAGGARAGGACGAPARRGRPPAPQGSPESRTKRETHS